MKLFFQLLALCLLAVGVSVADSMKQSVLQFRLVVENPTPNSEEVILPQKNSNEKIQVLKDVLLDATAVKFASEANVTNISLMYNGSGKADSLTNIGPQINLEFTEEGAKKLQEITSQHIGDRLAIFIDGKLMLAPRISSPISSGKAQIVSQITKKEAEDLVQKINESVVK
jgi:preprotein translocase subunit SecD